MNVSYDDKSSIPQYNPTSIYQLLKDPHYFSIILLISIIVLYVILFSFIGTGNYVKTNETSYSFRYFEIIIFIIFIIVVIANLHFFMNFQDLDFNASLTNMFYGNKPSMNVNIGQKYNKNPTSSSEVFHIPNNTYTYEEGKSLCKAYGAELATYDQIEDAYKNGANWCSYGWSSKQLALFPTQKSIYNELQKHKGHENDCGRPGINGGFISNPNVKFGVNCFGEKPKLNELDKQYMNALNNKSFIDPKESETINDFKTKLDTTVVAPFNHSKWRESQLT